MPTITHSNTNRTAQALQHGLLALFIAVLVALPGIVTEAKPVTPGASDWSPDIAEGKTVAAGPAQEQASAGLQPTISRRITTW